MQVDSRTQPTATTGQADTARTSRPTERAGQHSMSQASDPRVSVQPTLPNGDHVAQSQGGPTSAPAVQPVQPQHPPPPKFKDPFQECDKLQGRLPGKYLAFQGPEWNQSRRYNPTPAASALMTYLLSIQATHIEPKDVPGDFIAKMSKDEVDTAIRNTNVHMAHLHSKKYKSQLKGPKWSMTFPEKQRCILPGVVFQAPIVQNLHNRALELDDPDRGSHALGPDINKIRSFLCKQRDNGDVEAWEMTGFGDNGAPHPEKASDYVRLAHESDLSDPAGAQGLPVVRYDGNNHLTKTTFYRFPRTVWIGPESTPIAYEGRLIPEGFETAADVMEWTEEYGFRRIARGLRAERARIAEEEEMRNNW